MRDIPIKVLLSWPKPNYIDPPTRGNSLVIVNAIFISLATIAVCLRVYTRVWVKRWFGIDDWFILVALLFTIGLTVAVILANVQFGWNRHVWDIPFGLYAANLKVAFIAKLTFVAAATFTRGSLLGFYYRLSHDSSIQWFRWALHATTVFNFSIGIAFFFLGIFLCTPVDAYWQILKPKGAKCLDEGIATLIVGIFNCIADLLVTILPIPVIMSLQMPMRQRIGVSVLLSLGFIVTAAGGVRTYYIWRSLMASYDETWYAYPLWIWAAVEIDLGVICACAPSLRQLLTNGFSAFKRKVTSLRSSKSAATATASNPRAGSKPSKLSSGLSRSNKSKAPTDKDIQVTTTFELSHIDTSTFVDSVPDESSFSRRPKDVEMGNFGVLPRTSSEESLLFPLQGKSKNSSTEHMDTISTLDPTYGPGPAYRNEGGNRSPIGNAPWAVPMHHAEAVQYTTECSGVGARR